MGRPVVHFEIIGKDAKKLQDFYAKLFDWKIDANNPMNYGLVEANEGGPPQGVGGGIGPSMDGKTLVTFYVQVVDLNETLKQAESLGGKAVMQPMEVPGGPTIAQFTDPEGNLIGLIKQ
jgi:predicted enzyme related to lactoylglutathione lyase